jgi:5-formyltetrahydrofolate cyclo-ligase
MGERHANDRIVSERKARLRSELRARRSSLAPELALGASLALRQHAADVLDALPTNAIVAGYLATGSEIDPAPTLVSAFKRGLQVALPVIASAERIMRFRIWDGSQEHLQRSRLGTVEPRVGAWLDPSECALICLPLLGFDRHGTRLGQGGGFYDACLTDVVRQPLRPTLIGFAYAMQECEALPKQAWDVPLDAVLLETGLLRLPY